MLHAHYPADGWPENPHSLDFNPERVEPRRLPLPIFVRDVNQMLARAEGAFVHRADRDLPELLLVAEGIRLLAEVVERAALLAHDLSKPEKRVRTAYSILAIFTLRGARAIVLLLEPGYVPEAGVIVSRITSAVEIARLFGGTNPESVDAERFIAGAGLDELEPDTWTSIAESVGANVHQLPQLGLARIVR